MKYPRMCLLFVLLFHSFFIYAQKPVIKTITDAGSEIRITGENLVGGLGAVVFFGNVAIDPNLASPNLIFVDQPPITGTVDVFVVTIPEQEKSNIVRFTFCNAGLGLAATLALPSAINLKGCQKVRSGDECHPKVINILTWDAPPDGSDILGYTIYRDECLTKVAGTVFSDGPLKFKDIRRKEKSYTYYIVSFDVFGNTSAPAKIKVKKPCRRQNIPHEIIKG